MVRWQYAVMPWAIETAVTFCHREPLPPVAMVQGLMEAAEITLAELGEQGWEVCGVIPGITQGNPSTLLLKQPLESPA